MKKSLGIDFGFARIGIAISNNEKTMALPLKTIKGSKNLEEACNNILDGLSDRLKEVDEIILGLPLNLNSSESLLSQTVRMFGKILEEKTQLKVIFFDERLTSKAVEQDLRALSLSRKKRTKYIDQSAATLILQNYLDASKC